VHASERKEDARVPARGSSASETMSSPAVPSFFSNSRGLRRGRPGRGRLIRRWGRRSGGLGALAVAEAAGPGRAGAPWPEGGRRCRSSLEEVAATEARRRRRGRGRRRLPRSRRTLARRGGSVVGDG